MYDKKFKSIAGMSWEAAASRSNELLLEAFRLDELAYRMLAAERVCPVSWDTFAAAKRAAAQKSHQARREWLSATRLLHSIDSKAGRCRDLSLEALEAI